MAEITIKKDQIIRKSSISYYIGTGNGNLRITGGEYHSYSKKTLLELFEKRTLIPQNKIKINWEELKSEITIELDQISDSKIDKFVKTIDFYHVIYDDGTKETFYIFKADKLKQAVEYLREKLKEAKGIV